MTAKHTVPQEVIEKLRKCLALSRGTNFEAESETAMRMAKRIMDQYGLSMADVEMDKETAHVRKEAFAEASGYEARDLWPWEKTLGRVVENLLPVKFFLSGDYRNAHIKFIGVASDSALAAEVYKILRVELLRLSRVESSAKDKRSFLTGCVTALLRRSDGIRREREEAERAPSRSKALVVVKANDVAAYVEKTYKFVSAAQRGSAVNDDSFARGHAAGQRVDLNFGKSLK